jgi:hypothetical protein
LFEVAQGGFAATSGGPHNALLCNKKIKFDLRDRANPIRWFSARRAEEIFGGAAGTGRVEKGTKKVGSGAVVRLRPYWNSTTTQPGLGGGNKLEW